MKEGFPDVSYKFGNGSWRYGDFAFRNSELRNTAFEDEVMFLRVFVPRRVNDGDAVRLSRRADFWAMRHARVHSKGIQRRVKVSTAYKRKADKVRPVDTDQSDGSVPGGRSNWRDATGKKVTQARVSTTVTDTVHTSLHTHEPSSTSHSKSIDQQHV